MTAISATIITYNEEKKIGRCLSSLQNIVDEIIVVDSLSTDRTKNICQSYKVTFIEQKFLGYVEQKNFALSKASHDYVLSLDADEVLDKELQQSIVKIKPKLYKDSYVFKRLTNYAGFWVKHCGWYPNLQLRLFNRKKASWGGSNPHDKVVTDDKASMGFLEGNLLHYSYESISDHIKQTDRFTTIAAEAAYNRGIRANFIKIILRTFFAFLRDYIIRRGILDGRYGFIICYINALAVLLKYAKIKELQEGKTL